MVVSTSTPRWTDHRHVLLETRKIFYLPKGGLAISGNGSGDLVMMPFRFRLVNCPAADSPLERRLHPLVKSNRRIMASSAINKLDSILSGGVPHGARAPEVLSLKRRTPPIPLVVAVWIRLTFSSFRPG